MRMLHHNQPLGSPWGGGKQDPPNLGEVFYTILHHLKKMLPGGRNSSFFIPLIIFFLTIIFWTCFYTVPSDSVAVIQRFGKYVHIVPAGLHLKMPLDIDTAEILPVKRQLKQVFGVITPMAKNPNQSPRINTRRQETQMVTGDLNAALVEWVVQYRISNPIKFLFEIREPSETLRYVSESVMREVS